MSAYPVGLYRICATCAARARPRPKSGDTLPTTVEHAHAFLRPCSSCSAGFALWVAELRVLLTEDDPK